MRLLRWGDKYPFYSYIINRYYHLYMSVYKVKEDEVDIDEFLDFLYEHYTDGDDPLFPIDILTSDDFEQMYEAFPVQIEETLSCLPASLLKKVTVTSTFRKALLASELIIMQYLDRVGGYQFKPADLQKLVSYCEGFEE